MKLWMLSGPQRADALSNLDSSPNHGQIDSKPQLTHECMLRPWSLTSPFCWWFSFFVSVTQTLFFIVKWIGTELVSQLNDTCLGQAPLCLWCLVAHMQACERCTNASRELVCMVCRTVLSGFLRHIAENHRVRTAGCILLLWTNSLLDAVAS